MKNATPTFSVVLRPNLPPEERDFLRRFCCTARGESGTELLHFLCSRIDLSHPHYIEMETFRPSDDRTWPIRIPHHLVLLISGAESDTPIGFLTGG